MRGRRESKLSGIVSLPQGGNQVFQTFHRLSFLFWGAGPVPVPSHKISIDIHKGPAGARIPSGAAAAAWRPHGFGSGPHGFGSDRHGSGSERGGFWGNVFNTAAGFRAFGAFSGGIPGELWTDGAGAFHIPGFSLRGSDLVSCVTERRPAALFSVCSPAASPPWSSPAFSGSPGPSRPR